MFDGLNANRGAEFQETIAQAIRLKICVFAPLEHGIETYIGAKKPKEKMKMEGPVDLTFDGSVGSANITENPGTRC